MLYILASCLRRVVACLCEPNVWLLVVLRFPKQEKVINHPDRQVIEASLAMYGSY